MAVMEFFCPYEPINTLEALLCDFGDFDFAENFLRIFLRFSRGVLIKTLRLSYCLSNLVVWEPQKFSIIQKNKSKVTYFFRHLLS